MKKTLIGCALLTFLMAAPTVRADSLLDASGSDLYGMRPIKVGELVTVVIQDNVSTTQVVATKSETTNNLSGPTGTGILAVVPTIGLNTKGTAGRTESAQTQQNFQNTVTARVVEVLPGDVLVLEAKTRVELDGKVRSLTFHGKVRRAEVPQGNVITSDKVCDTDIRVDGAQASPNGGGGLMRWFLFPFR